MVLDFELILDNGTSVPRILIRIRLSLMPFYYWLLDKNESENATHSCKMNYKCFMKEHFIED